MYKSCSPKAFQWLSTKEKFTMEACAKFHCREIAEKFSLKFSLCITNLVRLIQTSLLLFLVPRLGVLVWPRKSTNKPIEVSTQPTAKWMERISQSERVLHLFATQFHFFALVNCTDHWFGINWPVLSQSEFRNRCVYIIMVWLPHTFSLCLSTVNVFIVIAIVACVSAVYYLIWT